MCLPKLRHTNGADVQMWLATDVLSEARGWGHCEQGRLLATEHHAWSHERSLESRAAGQKSLSEGTGEHD